jgi:glycosyltransferase involved in cell wall biosynthesis
LAEVAALYAIADIGLMTLVDSPFFAGTRPARIYPAMAAGKPIVYSGAGEGASLIQEARAGLIVPPADAEALLQAVNRLLSDKELASEMGRSGRDYVERTLTWDHLVEQWLHELEGQLAGQR